MRIISGELGGRDLGSVPNGVRPTSDRVRESLFSTLGNLTAVRVLDLFAGTGALGLEALSRGAAHVVFVERSRRVARELTRRLERLDLGDSDAIDVLVTDAQKAIRRLRLDSVEPFDLVFLDPPYDQGEREPTLRLLFSAGILAAHARVVVEGPKRHPLCALPGARVVDERHYGDTTLTWLESSGPVADCNRESK
jgi:16S rRNA (guanine966-N2)-methyltransferase